LYITPGYRLIALDAKTGTLDAKTGTPKTMNNTKGLVRGFDVRTGKRLWIFRTIPQKGEFGYDTWLDGSAEHTGNTASWTQLSVDEQLGLAYLPIESPTGDYYAGFRLGNNLFGESLVCVDLKPDSVSGIISWSIIRSGTWTSPQPRSWPTST
jgi:glucose dehydrogenase